MPVQLSIIAVGRRDEPDAWTSVVAAVELHVNATYYVQQPALKSVYGKDQSVIAGKLFPSCIGKCLAQGLLEISKQVA